MEVEASIVPIRSSNYLAGKFKNSPFCPVKGGLDGTPPLNINEQIAETIIITIPLAL